MFKNVANRSISVCACFVSLIVLEVLNVFNLPSNQAFWHYDIQHDDIQHNDVQNKRHLT